MTAGVLWEAQLAAAAVAAAFGAAASPLTLLYKGNVRPVKRITADFIATAGIALLFLLSAETGAQGQLTIYCAAAYLVAVAAGGRALRAALAALQKKFPALFGRRKRALKSRQEKITSPQDDNQAPSSSRCNRRRAAGHSAVSRRKRAARALPRPQADGRD